MFDCDVLINDAERLSGLTDFGPEPLREGLQVLCRALDAEAQLSTNGRAAATQEILGSLVERLKVQDWYRRAPHIEDQQILAPLWVVGLPRSGTTALSQMFAQDPANRSIRRWEAAQPTPPPDIDTEAADPRVISTQRMLKARYADSPELMAMNPVTVHDPSENDCFLRHTFQSLSFAGVYNIPSYMQWALQCDMRPAYRYFLRVLKLLQWRRPATRWNLKFPLDLFYLDAIAEIVPDARLVWSHRDPVKTIPSVASLLAARRRPFTEVVDKVELGLRERDFRLEQLRRGMAYRDRADGLPIVDVYNVDVVRDPIGAVQGIYDKLGLPFLPEYRRRLAELVVERPRGRFGRHHYTAEEFGLVDSELAAAFSAYTKRYHVPPDS